MTTPAGVGDVIDPARQVFNHIAGDPNRVTPPRTASPLFRAAAKLVSVAGVYAYFKRSTVVRPSHRRHGI